MRQWVAAMMALALAGIGCAQGPKPVDTPPDYASPASWLCRPGVDDGTCSAGLDALAFDAAGKSRPRPYQQPKGRPIDCFFVYPTVSDDPGPFSDMNADESEKRAVHAEAARLGERCRLYVPIYRQLTRAGLGEELAGGKGAKGLDLDRPYRDILAAWQSYLARDNHGRGVVLVGHSQGAMILKRLIAEEIDGKPAQKLLVAAYLAGNTDLTTASFRAVPPCASAAQTGCVIAWSTYPEDHQGPRFFGNGTAGQSALCVNPAAPGGGRGMLKSFFAKPSAAPAGDPPYVEALGQLSGQCVTDADGNAILSVRIEPDGAFAELLQTLFARSAGSPWGLHPLDIALVQGNMLDLIGSEADAWAQAH